MSLISGMPRMMGKKRECQLMLQRPGHFSVSYVSIKLVSCQPSNYGHAIIWNINSEVQRMTEAWEKRVEAYMLAPNFINSNPVTHSILADGAT